MLRDLQAGDLVWHVSGSTRMWPEEGLLGAGFPWEPRDDKGYLGFEPPG
jgi:hypothetical protein